MKKIGIVGAGLMASGMAQNFLKNRYRVYVYNRSPERLGPLIHAGATQCDSPRFVAAKADIVIECVSDDEASRGVWVGDEGILAGADSYKVLITSATLSLDWVDELAKICKEQSLQFLDMPLTGGRVGAETGNLKLLVGGDEALLNSIRQDLEAIASQVFHFGAAGSGTRFKLILNTLSAVQIDAAAQAVELAKKAGIEPAAMQKALFDGDMPPASKAIGMLLRDMDTPDDYVSFAIKWIEKDLRYAKDMADKFGVSFNLLNDTQRDYAQAKKQGLGQRDWSKVIELYRQKGGEIKK